MISSKSLGNCVKYIGLTFFSYLTVFKSYSTSSNKLKTVCVFKFKSGKISSGTFSFASTGLYLVSFIVNLHVDSSGDGNMTFTIKGTADDSSYDDLAEAQLSGDTSNNQRQSTMTSTLFNCTNTSTHKIRFATGSMNNNNLEGDTDVTRSGFLFIRLGDSQ